MQDYNLYDHKDDINIRKVSLEKVIRQALRRWKLILIGGVILGCLFGSYKILNEHRQKAQTQAAYDAYQTQMEAYKRQQTSIRNQVQSVQNKIEERQNYLAESIKMQLDPAACPQAFVEIYIRVPEVDPEIDSESKTAIYKLTSILKAFYDDILFGVGTKQLAAKYGVEEKYFTELIAPMYDYYTSSIRVQVRYTDEQTAMQILDDLIAIMQGKVDAYRELFGDFDFEIYIKDSTTLADNDLATFQYGKVNELTQMQNGINVAMNAQSNLTIPNVVKPYSKKQLLKDGIKFGIVGFVGGCCLMLLWFMCLLIAKGRIFTSDEIDGEYGLRNLANFAYGKKDRLPEKMDLALAQIENALRGSDIRNLAVVGTLPEKKLAALAKLFTDKEAEKKSGEATEAFLFTPVPDVTDKAASLRALQEYDGFIVAEEIGRSDYRKVHDEIRLLSETGRSIVGTIYL